MRRTLARRTLPKGERKTEREGEHEGEREREIEGGGEKERNIMRKRKTEACVVPPSGGCFSGREPVKKHVSRQESPTRLELFAFDYPPSTGSGQVISAA